MCRERPSGPADKNRSYTPGFNNGTELTADSAGCAKSVLFSRFRRDPITSRSGRSRCRSSSPTTVLNARHRVSGVQSHSHAQPLGALAGEGEHRLTRHNHHAPNNRAAQLVAAGDPANNDHGPPATARYKTERPANDHPTSAASGPSSATHVRASRLPRLRLRRHHPQHRPASLPPRHHRHRLDNHIGAAKRRHPARRVRAPAGHTRGAVQQLHAPADQSTCGPELSRATSPGNSSWRIANTMLITPATATACV